MGIPIRTRAPLEIIRFAAANHLCIDLHYQGSVRRIEPYSLRRSSQGNYVLHAVKFDTGEARSYRMDRIEGAEVTQQTFSPRYLVELTTEGPLVIPESAARIGASRRQAVHRTTERRKTRRASLPKQYATQNTITEAILPEGVGTTACLSTSKVVSHKRSESA